MTKRPETITDMRTDPRPIFGALALAALLTLTACGERAVETGGSDSSWSVTAWGSSYEVFPEVGPLVAGETAVAHTHVTRLGDFSPLTEGRVEIVLAGTSGGQSFGSDEPVRPGIYEIELNPGAAGEYDLLFRITTPSGTEEIRGGRVRVGTADDPGSIVRAPAPKGATGGGAPVDFLKEQQWSSEFGTDWVRSGRLPVSSPGLARVRPPAGGEAAITAPFDAVVRPAGDWPFPGFRVAGGGPLFQLVPTVAAGSSLSALDAAAREVGSELVAARARLARLEELAGLDAVSGRELEEARTRVETLEARQQAANDDLAAARASRGGGGAGSVTLRAPFSGAISRVAATPGTTVSAGQELARLVRTDSLWLEISLPPAGARQVSESGIAGIVLVDREHAPVRIDDELQLISVSPEISPDTGTVTVLVAVPATSGLALGSTVEAHVLSAAERTGIVVPSTAVIDDGGTPVVYLQLAGESFVRHEVSVLARQGDRLLVDHLVPGQRLVTKGGDAIRRESLMSSGAAEGHVH